GSARTRRREHRHVDPLPARAPAERVSPPARPAPARPAGDGTGRARGPVSAVLAGPLRRRRARRRRRAAPRPRAPLPMKRSVRVALTLVVLAAAVGYIVYKVDLRKTIDILRSASVPWLIASAVLTLVTVPPQAWRWQQLLRVRGLRETVGWLTRTYFVSY